jgi:ubiquinone/menaquinone biosynthesis C-methylase UbiE
MTLQKDPEGNERHTLHKYVEFNNQRVLEIGCGEGRLTWQYAKKTHRTVGVDLDRDSLRVAVFDTPASLNDRTFFSCADSRYLPFSKEAFDIAILAWSL